MNNEEIIDTILQLLEDALGSQTLNFNVKSQTKTEILKRIESSKNIKPAIPNITFSAKTTKN